MTELLTEGEVAERVGISRTPVREAFLQLQSENMLRHDLRAYNDHVRAALKGNDRTFREADRGLHEHWIAAAGNQLLNSFYSTLRDRQMRGGSRALADRPARGEAIVDQHDALLDALALGDPAAATSVLREHLRDTALTLGLAPIDEIHTG